MPRRNRTADKPGYVLTSDPDRPVLCQLKALAHILTEPDGVELSRVPIAPPASAVFTRAEMRQRLAALREAALRRQPLFPVRLVFAPQSPPERFRGFKGTRPPTWRAWPWYPGCLPDSGGAA